jgi:integral membrane sensor domain MASE1
LLLLWTSNPRVEWSRSQVLEAGILLVGLILVSEIVFSEFFHSEYKHFSLDFICIPFLIWAAFRFTQREAATAVVLLSTNANIGTMKGVGAFSRQI